MCITEWQCLQKQNTVISDIRITSLDAIIFFFWSATNNYTRSRKRENRIMKTITKHLKRTKTLCENNRKQQLTSTLYWVKFVSYLLLNEVIISLYMLCFSVLCIIWFLLIRKCLFFLYLRLALYF